MIFFANTYTSTSWLKQNVVSNGNTRVIRNSLSNCKKLGVYSAVE